jgi:hypothetical protein
MINLPSVTLICLSSIKLPTAIEAIKHCCQYVNFGDVKLVTHENIQSDSLIKVEKSPQFYSLQNYSDYLVANLSDHFETTHCLHIQMDGLISNYKMWTDEYLDYDYIGAPWPLPLVAKILQNVSNEKDHEGRPFETNKPNLQNYDINNYRVGNGGFSLRSKKLCDLLKQYAYKYPNKSEDCIISIYEKESLLEEGVKYAPLELASKFAVEDPTELNPIKDTSKTFGFHRF